MTLSDTLDNIKLYMDYLVNRKDGKIIRSIESLNSFINTKLDNNIIKIFVGFISIASLITFITLWTLWSTMKSLKNKDVVLSFAIIMTILFYQTSLYFLSNLFNNNSMINNFSLFNILYYLLLGIYYPLKYGIDGFQYLLKNFQSTIIQIGIGMVIFLISLTVILYYALNDPKLNISNLSHYYSLILIPLLGLIMYLLYKTSIMSNPLILIITTISLICFIFLASYLYSKIDNVSIKIMFYIFSSLSIIIGLIGLAIFFYIFSNYLKSIPGVLGFLIYLLFYIPCLIIEFVQYIKKELNMTSNIVYILFILEIILILLYLYIPKLLSLVKIKNRVIIRNEPIFLDNETSVSVANNDEHDIRNQYLLSDVNNKTTLFYRNYSISFWLYINPQENANYNSSKKETNILSYKSNNGGGKPRMTYLNDNQTKNATDQVIIYYTDTPNVSGIIVNLDKQKWNNIVFNYSGNNIDLFINGNLENSFMIDTNQPIYSNTDTFTIGETNGIYGSICNIEYYKYTLSKIEIINSYNLLLNKNPPINII
jgi:hypothetical protein